MKKKVIAVLLVLPAAAMAQTPGGTSAENNKALEAIVVTASRSGEDAQESYRTPTAALPASFRRQRSNYGAGMQRFTGIFGQFKFSPLDPLEISLSTRWDTYSSSRGQAIQTNYTNVATLPRTGEPRFFTGRPPAAEVDALLRR